METADTWRLADFTERLVGFELENQILDGDGAAVTFDRMQEVWPGFAPLGWELRVDPFLGVISGAQRSFDGNSVNLSSDCSAGNLEAALAPMPTVSEADTLRRAILDDVLSVLGEHDLRLCALGMHPGQLGDLDRLRVRSSLYVALERMGGVDRFNNATSLPVSANQAGVSVHLDEAIRVVNALTAVSGLLLGVCANSAVSEWRPLRWKEWRVLSWDFRFVGPKPGFECLSGFPASPFTSLADHYRHYWTLPHMVLPPIRDSGWVVPDEKMPVLDYLARPRVQGRDLSGRPVDLIPSGLDLNLAMTSMWPLAKLHLMVDEAEVAPGDFVASLGDDELERYLPGRLANSYVEFRALAATPVGEEATVPALFLGLVNNVGAVEELVARHPWTAWRALVPNAARRGLDAELGAQPIVPLIEELLAAATDGLAWRGHREEAFLAPLNERLRRNRCPADDALAALARGRAALLDWATY